MKHVLLAVFLFVLIAAAQTAPPRPTANNLKADVSFLASDALEGRGTPSRGLEIAAEFVASQFRAAGLDPAGDDGYFQTASFVSITPNLDGLQVTVEIGGKRISIDKSKMALGEPTALDLEGRAAVVAPASLDDLSPEQTTGKVLIVNLATRFGRVSRAAIQRLQPALLLMLTINPGTRVNSGPQLREPSAAPFPPSVLFWDDALRDALGEFKPGPLDGSVSVHIAAPRSEPVQLRNVVGVLRGSDLILKDTFVLLTAHYDHLGVRGTGAGDHIFNGANDDASGTASVIEIARSMAAAPARPRRSVVFIALFGEEAGLLGSRYYAAHPVFPLTRTVGDLNLEHMGRTDVTGGARVGVLNATGFDYTDLTAVLRTAGVEFGVRVEKDEQNSDPFFARSDNQAFADAGVPSTTLSVGYIFPEYHQPGDEWQKIDYENMAKVDAAVALGVFRIADSQETPKWNASNPKTEAYRKARP